MTAARTALGRGTLGTRHDIAAEEQGVGGYEAHLTFHRAEAAQVQALALTSDWKFSQIDGDPILGDEVFCYLTAYSRSLNALRNRLTAAEARAGTFGIPVLRSKIEHIIYDARRSA